MSSTSLAWEKERAGTTSRHCQDTLASRIAREGPFAALPTSYPWGPDKPILARKPRQLNQTLLSLDPCTTYDSARDACFVASVHVTIERKECPFHHLKGKISISFLLISELGDVTKHTWLSLFLYLFFELPSSKGLPIRPPLCYKLWTGLVPITETKVAHLCP